MNWQAIGIGTAWAVGGFIFGSFVEYWGHRFMHAVTWGPGKTHREHHARGTAQGVLLEFWDYFKFTWILMWPPFVFVSTTAGIGWVIGALFFIFFSSFGHQLQHENPKRCFWMPRPVHYIHHTHNQWHHNFGLSLDIWDRVFGTYKKMEWEDRLKPEQAAATKHFWQINWLWGGNAGADRRMEEVKKQKLEGRQQKAQEAQSADF